MPTNVNTSPEIIGINLVLIAKSDYYLKKQNQVALHAWFLNQVRQTSPTLSQILHDDQKEKAFTISELKGEVHPESDKFQLKSGSHYYLKITALSNHLVAWLEEWMQKLPEIISIYNGQLKIIDCQINLQPTTYSQLWENAGHKNETIQLSFLSPTSFKRKGHHFPLPVPMNLFHSYLRRWNCFSCQTFEETAFLNWIEESVIILRHQITSQKVQVAKAGSVTGFTGAIELGLDKSGRKNLEYTQLFYALSDLAPYCGTGHKTPFGLGETVSGWITPPIIATITKDRLLNQRIEELETIFLAKRQHKGGNRAKNMAQKLAVILARRETGESLRAISSDLNMPYETVKTYVKLARQEVRDSNLSSSTFLNPY